MTEVRFDWLEFRPRPKKDGLHDSGYRYIALTGVVNDDGVTTKTPLHQWSDHVVLGGPANIDVEPDGTIRLMPWSGGGWKSRDADSGLFYSSAMFKPTDVKKAIKYLELGL